jgi:hypothetical protein
MRMAFEDGKESGRINYGVVFLGDNRFSSVPGILGIDSETRKGNVPLFFACHRHDHNQLIKGLLKLSIEDLPRREGTARTLCLHRCAFPCTTNQGDPTHPRTALP